MVIKLGTEILLTKEGEAIGCLDQEVFDNIAAQVVYAKTRIGVHSVTLVSSAGIQAGRERIRQFVRNPSFLNKRDLAGIGARHLLNRWGNAFGIYDCDVGQIWVTPANWKNISEWRNIQWGIQAFNYAGIIPIVNENDAVSDRGEVSSTDHLSENDRIARMVARCIGADAILFLTSVGGVYERDPHTYPDARMYETIDIATIKKLLGAPFTVSSNGTGGMRAKLIEAMKCFRAGMRVAIAGMADDVIPRFAQTHSVGTTTGISTSFY